MQAHQVSKTAMGTAFMRAYHASHDHPKIFDDHLAHRLITAEEYRESVERHLKAFQLFDPVWSASCSDRDCALSSWMQSAAAPAIVLGRAQYAEGILEQALKQQQVRQYVILGAGMDTFAFRRRDLLARLQVFEVDRPATQAHKRQRILELGEPPPQLHFIKVDFSQENLAAALRNSAYNPQIPTFFSWLGVTYYLSREAAFATLAAIAQVAPAGSGIIFDYLDADAFVPEKVARRVQFMMEIVSRVGEPMLTGFDPSTLSADLAGLGLGLHEDLGPAEIQSNFFKNRTDDYHASEHAHFAWAKVD
jgi:methyltransferase (TIGR00027 family)